jgi:hypothetical protein
MSALQAIITHFGTVEFQGGGYVRTAGSDNWKVWPIEGFDPPIRAPVGQIRIDFAEPITEPYTILLSGGRVANAPLMSANWGGQDENGFVVHLWETIADRTLQNGNFSFAVLQTD